nr:hypothetical protein [Tanacetum cinerariifolium]
ITTSCYQNRGKAIVNSPQPIYDQEPSMVTKDDETSKDKEIDKLMALISLSFKKIYKPTNNNLRTSSNTSRANQDNSPRINKNAGYENQRIGNVAGARENVGSSMEEADIQLNAGQADWRDDTDDDELEDQELKVHYMCMAQLQKVSPDAADSGPIFDDEPLQKNDDDNDLAKERELLASLIEKLKYEIDESKNRQSVQTMNMLNNKCRTSFAKPEFLKKAQTANPCLYDIGCYNDNLALMLAPESDEVIRLEKEIRSKLIDLIRPFDYDKLNNLYDLFVPQHEVTNLQCDYLELLEKYEGLETELSKNKIMSKSFESVQKHAINLELEDLKAQLQDKGIVISELKKLIEKLKGKSVDTKFEKSLVIRRPNAFKSQRPSILSKPTTFSNSFVRKDFSKSKSVTQNNVSNDFSKPVAA